MDHIFRDQSDTLDKARTGVNNPIVRLDGKKDANPVWLG